MSGRLLDAEQRLVFVLQVPRRIVRVATGLSDVHKAAGFYNVLPVAAADQIRTTAGNTYKTAAWLRDEPRGIPGSILKRNEHLRTQPWSSESALEEAAP